MRKVLVLVMAVSFMFPGSVFAKSILQNVTFNWIMTGVFICGGIWTGSESEKYQDQSSKKKVEGIRYAETATSYAFYAGYYLDWYEWTGNRNIYNLSYSYAVSALSYQSMSNKSISESIESAGNAKRMDVYSMISYGVGITFLVNAIIQSVNEANEIKISYDISKNKLLLSKKF